MSKIERSDMSIVGIESSLEYARQKHAVIVAQLFNAVHEIEQFEIALRNAKRATGDLRPLEHTGNMNCIPHEWHGDLENEQMFCGKEGCGARFDFVAPELGYEYLPKELVAELLAGPIDVSPEELQNATEKAAEVLRSGYLSLKVVDSLLRGVCGDDAQENINKLGFPGSTKNVNHEVTDTHPTFDPDVHRGPEIVSSAGWESVRSGGFSGSTKMKAQEGAGEEHY